MFVIFVFCAVGIVCVPLLDKIEIKLSLSNFRLSLIFFSSLKDSLFDINNSCCKDVNGDKSKEGVGGVTFVKFSVLLLISCLLLLTSELLITELSFVVVATVVTFSTSDVCDFGVPILSKPLINVLLSVNKLLFIFCNSESDCSASLS